jgi:hypothetical protein
VQSGLAQSLAEALTCQFQLSGEAAGHKAHQGLQGHADGQNDAEVSESGVGDKPFAHLQGDESQRLRRGKRRRPPKLSPPGIGAAEAPDNAECEHQRHAQEGDEGNGVQSRRQVLVACTRQQLVAGVIVRSEEQVLGYVSDTYAGQRHGDDDQRLAGSDAALHGRSIVPVCQRGTAVGRATRNRS